MNSLLLSFGMARISVTIPVSYSFCIGFGYPPYLNNRSFLFFAALLDLTVADSSFFCKPRESYSGVALQYSHLLQLQDQEVQFSRLPGPTELGPLPTKAYDHMSQVWSVWQIGNGYRSVGTRPHSYIHQDVLQLYAEISGVYLFLIMLSYY